MTTYAFPDLVPKSSEWWLESNTQTFTSPFTRAVQTIELAGARWRAVMDFSSLQGAEARALAAFLVRLRGGANRFTIYDHSMRAPLGIATGTPLVNGASQTGSTLITDGWTVSQAGILLAGDYISVNGELKMVVTDANSDGSGNSTLTIEPPLRSSPADDAAITVTNPPCVMMLASDNQAKWANSPKDFHSFVIECVEAFQ